MGVIITSGFLAQKIKRLIEDILTYKSNPTKTEKEIKEYFLKQLSTLECGLHFDFALLGHGSGDLRNPLSIALSKNHAPALLELDTHFPVRYMQLFGKSYSINKELGKNLWRERDYIKSSYIHHVTNINDSVNQYIKVMKSMNIQDTKFVDYFIEEITSLFRDKNDAIVKTFTRGNDIDIACFYAGDKKVTFTAAQAHIISLILPFFQRLFLPLKCFCWVIVLDHKGDKIDFMHKDKLANGDCHALCKYIDKEMTYMRRNNRVIHEKPINIGYTLYSIFMAHIEDYFTDLFIISVCKDIEIVTHNYAKYN